MIDPRLVVRFLNRTDIKLSFEEFLLLWTIKALGEESPANRKELEAEIQKYYSSNTSFLIDKTTSIKYDWNAMIKNLTEKGFLRDFREDQNSAIDLKKFAISESFYEKAWNSDKEEVWERLQQFVYDNCGEGIKLENKTISYFFVNQSDPVINSPEKLKNYFWINICQEGSLHHIEKFFVYFAHYLRENELSMKISNFFINYHEGTLKKEIETSMNKETKGSYFKSL